MAKRLPPDPLDPQRDRVYAAEKAAFQDRVPLPLEELRAFAAEVQTSAWWRRSFPRQRPVAVKDGRGDSFARRHGNEIHIPRKSRRKDLVVHEFGHVVTPDGVEWHGEAFCGTVLFLYGKVFGADAKDRVRREFKARSVRWDARLARYGP